MATRLVFRHVPSNSPVRMWATMLSAYRQPCRHLSDDSPGIDHSKTAGPSDSSSGEAQEMNDKAIVPEVALALSRVNSVSSGNTIWSQLHPAVAVQDTPSTVLVLHPPLKTSIIARLLKEYRTFVFASTGKLFSLARFRTTHEASGAAQYLRRQGRVPGLSVGFMAEPALSKIIRFRFGMHKRLGNIVEVIERHVTKAESYAIQPFLDVQEVGIVVGFPSAELASEARNALLSTMDPLLAVDARFNTTFIDVYPPTLRVHPGPPIYRMLTSQIRDSRVANVDINGFGNARPQNQPLTASESMISTTIIAITGMGLTVGEARRIFKRYPGFYSPFAYRESFAGRFRTIYAAEQAFASLQRNPPAVNFSIRYLTSIPCSTVTVRFGMVGPVEPIAHIIEEHGREAFKFYLRQSLSFMIVQLAFPSADAATKSLRALQRAPSIALAHSAKFSASSGHSESLQEMKDWTIGHITSRVICSQTEIFFHRQLEKQVRKEEAIAKVQRARHAASAERSRTPKEKEDPKTKLARLVDPGTTEAVEDTKEFGTMVRDPPPIPTPDPGSHVEMPATASPQISHPPQPNHSTWSLSSNGSQRLTLPSASLRKWMLPLPPPAVSRSVTPMASLETFVLPGPPHITRRSKLPPLEPPNPNPETFMLPETPESQDRIPLISSDLADPSQPASSTSALLQTFSTSPSRRVRKFPLRKERRQTESSRGGPIPVDPTASHPSFRRSRPKTVNGVDPHTGAGADVPEPVEDGGQRSESLPWAVDVPATQKF